MYELSVLGEKMFRLNLKRFIKNKIMVSVVIVIFFLVTIYIYKDDEIKWTSRPYLPIQDSLKIMPVLFFLFMILSYEIFYHRRVITFRG